MKLPEREIQKSLNILKAHQFLSALQEQGKSTLKQAAVKEGSLSSPLVLEGVHIWKTERFRDAVQYGENRLVSMATSAMETWVRAQQQSGIETP